MITEDPVAGYSSNIDGFTVTNRHTPPTTPPSTPEKPETPTTPKEGKKKILPSTGEVVAYGLTILGALLAIFALALLLRGKRKEK